MNNFYCTICFRRQKKKKEWLYRYTYVNYTILLYNPYILYINCIHSVYIMKNTHTYVRLYIVYSILYLQYMYRQ